jgi:hypothetical protein
VDYWGHPKPAYAAYAQLVRRLEGKRFSRRFELPQGVQVYEFAGERENCFVMWAFPESRQRIMLDWLRPGIGPQRVVSVTSAVGSPLALSGAALTVTGMPVYVAVSNQGSNEGVGQ